MRKIIHIDMDAFYASIEQRDNPSLKGRPVAVGYSGERGVVAAASYEARKFGVRSAMPSKTALKKCPGLIFVNSRIDYYKEISRQIRDIFLEYTDLVENLSLDEAYLDVTENKKNMPSATLIAKEIKKRIKKETGLTASAGVSVNKFLAKVASDMSKPDGLSVITDKQAEKFAENLKIEEFWGVGKVTAEKMHGLGIYNGRDLKRFTEDELVRHFGKAGHTYYQNARAVDSREVEPDRIRKSMGAETTFLTDISERKDLRKELSGVAKDVWKRITKYSFKGHTVTLKIKYSDFKQITRSRTPGGYIEDYKLFIKILFGLLDGVMAEKDFTARKVRLIGATVSNNTAAGNDPQLRFDLDGEF